MNAGLIAREELSDTTRGEMFALFERHFEGGTHEGFRSDLDCKNWVLLMRGGDDQRLVGFSTLDFQAVDFRGEAESVVYSGDTIMDPIAWNSSILSRAWIEAVFGLHARSGRGHLWWLLLTSGFRTYRMLPVFWREFFPRAGADIPADVSARRDAFARQRFGSQYGRDSGIVRFEKPQRLRHHLQGIPAHRAGDRDITFFNERNPGHTEGDELVCLTRLEDANLTAAGKRIVDSIRRHPVLACRGQS